MVIAEEPSFVGVNPTDSSMASVTRPACRYAPARLLRVVKVFSMVVAENSLEVRQHAFVFGDGVGDAARLEVGVGEGGAHSEGAGVVRAEDALVIGEDVVELAHGVGGAACFEVGGGEVAAGDEGVGMVLAEYPRRSARTCWYSVIASAVWPARR